MNKKVMFAGLIGILILAIAISIINQTKKDLTYKQGKSKAKTFYNTALSMQAKGNLDQAIKLYEDLVKQFPQADRTADALNKLGEIYESKALLAQAKGAYAKIITDFPNFEGISDVEKRLWDLNIKLLFSPIVTEGDIVYKVEPKDTLAKIAAKYNTTVELIMRSNNLKSDLIRPGERLKTSNLKYSVIIDKSQNSLILKRDDTIFKVYSVATGKHNYTPAGNFKIIEKLKNPDWYKGGEGIILADSPENILGTRWLGLSEPQYGIHGGASEEDLGTQVTNGCIRMTNHDAEELFAILPRGTEVTIVD